MHNSATTVDSRGLIIGMDEAGYGPNLGPLVISATAWRVPGAPQATDLWREFADVVGPTPPVAGSHLQVADSKVVYTPSRGLVNLERGVLAALALLGCEPAGFRDLWQRLAPDHPGDYDAEPWFADQHLALPVSCTMPPAATLVDRWRASCQARQISLEAVCCDVVVPRRFNALVNQHGNKARALTEIAMGVLRRAWPAAADCPTLIIADKHGGRNRYQEFLQDLAGDQLVLCREEGASRSRYHIRNAEISFETQAERHFPVALASMVSKYLRELSMILFNRFWSSRQAGLKSTAGYPVDARRFRREIAALQSELAIPDAVLWRER